MGNSKSKTERDQISQVDHNILMKKGEAKLRNYDEIQKRLNSVI